MKYTKTLTWIVFITVLFPLYGVSQNVFVEFGGGVNIPLDPYSSQSDRRVGYAKSGAQGNLTIAYRLTNKYSLGLKGVFLENKQGGQNNLPGNFQGSPSGLLPWRVNTVFIDAGLVHEIQKKIFFELDLDLGIMNARFPIEPNGGNFSVISRASISDRTGNGLAGGVGLGLRFSTAENISLSAQMFFMSAKPKVQTDLYTFVQRINIYLISCGFIFDIKPTS